MVKGRRATSSTTSNTKREYQMMVKLNPPHSAVPASHPTAAPAFETSRGKKQMAEMATVIHKSYSSCESSSISYENDLSPYESFLEVVRQVIGNESPHNENNKHREENQQYKKRDVNHFLWKPQENPEWAEKRTTATKSRRFWEYNAKIIPSAWTPEVLLRERPRLVCSIIGVRSKGSSDRCSFVLFVSEISSRISTDGIRQACSFKCFGGLVWLCWIRDRNLRGRNSSSAVYSQSFLFRRRRSKVYWRCACCGHWIGWRW